MGFPSQLLDADQIPIAQNYIPGVGFASLQGSPTSNTDGQGNLSTPLSVDLAQIGDEPVTMGGTDGVAADDVLEVCQSLYNGLTLDMERGNMDGITVLSETASTVTVTSSMLKNYNHKGCIVALQTTSIGTGSITLSIQGIEPISNSTWTILSGSAVTTNTTVLYKVYPGLPAVANSIAQDILPRSWQVTVTANNANPATYGVYLIMCL